MNRFRCPVCLTLFWAAGSVCAGGWPVYDPKAEPGARHPEHAPTPVEPDRTDRSDG